MKINFTGDIVRKPCSYRDLIQEEEIAKDEQAYYYVKDVVCGRWPMGEEAISKSYTHSFLYAREIIRGRFELGEAAIARNGCYSYLYAIHIIKGRFELGEDAIYGTTSYYAQRYIDYLTHEN